MTLWFVLFVSAEIEFGKMFFIALGVGIVGTVLGFRAMYVRLSSLTGEMSG